MRRYKYWLHTALVTTVSAICVAAAFMAMMLLQGLDQVGEMLLIIAPYYLMMGGALMLLALCLAMYLVDLPLSISFGSTRADALRGLHIATVLPSLVLSLLSTAAMLLAGEKETLETLKAFPVMFLLLFIVGCASNLMGCAVVRFGTKGGVICGIACGLIGAGCGTGLTLGARSGKLLARLMDTYTSALLVIAVVALVLFVAELIMQKRMLRKYEVRM